MKELIRQYVKPELAVQLNQLSSDMRRILRIQWREFINEIIDAERDLQLRKVIQIRNVIQLPLPLFQRVRIA